jgi:hypothetical protein
VIGRLVRQYGFSVHIEASPYGGVRAMLRVPAELLTVLDDEHTLSVLVPAPAEKAAPRQPERPQEDTPVTEATPLPSRRRRSPKAAAARPVAPVPPSEPAPAARTPEQAGALWGALQDGTRSGRTAAAGAAATGDEQGEHTS